MAVLQFVSQYIRHPRKVGAILPSSRTLARQMMIPIAFGSAECIIEYGPGTGVFTEELIRRKRNETKLLVFENNEKFHQVLQKRFGDAENVFIIHDSAEHVSRYIEHYEIGTVNYIVSGLPFTSLPKTVTARILQETQNVLGENGEFITFQYSKLKQEFFQSFFNDIQVDKVVQNVPPAYVFTCSL